MLACADGLVRLTPDEMQSVVLVHLASDLDGPMPCPTPCGGATSISGYTEWVSVGTPVITLGWDWCVRPLAGPAHWTRINAPRSNVMLVDEQRRDIGWSANLKLLAAFVDTLPWVDCVREGLVQALRARR
jgi:hypothetical protein